MPPHPPAGLPRGPAARHTLADLAVLAGAAVPAAGAVLVEGLTVDSRAVRPGDLYAALPGARTHGAYFVAEAAAAGARAVLTDVEGARLGGGALPALVVPDPRAVLGSLAAALQGHPATRLTTFGVTGTNGKTTTTYLLAEALRAAGRRTGMIGTVEIRVDDERIPSARTTPEAPDVQGLLGLMVQRGVSDLVMEVSSHALSYRRVDGIVFDVAGFTNLSQDHLDFHLTMEAYFVAKADLFTPERSRCGVVVVDQEWGRRLAREARVPVVTLATRDGLPGDWQVRDPVRDGAGTAFRLIGPHERELAARCPLPGDFNVANTALALVMALQAGLEVRDAFGEAVTVPGRMETVPCGAPGAPLAVVDYAHTPDAVASALQALRPCTRGPLVVVLGAGGDRDPGKRPAMGAAASAHADVVLLTDDNPRSEDPAAIRAAVLAGVRPGAVVLEMPDRAAAIVEGVRRAWSSGGPAGTVLVAGKGHERGQEVAGVVHPFDDRQVLAAALAAMGTVAR